MKRSRFTVIFLSFAVLALPRPAWADRPPVTAAQANDLAQTLEAALNTGNEQGFASVVDIDGMARTAIEGILAPADFRDEFLAPDKLAPVIRALMADSVAKGTHYHLLRVHQRDGVPVAVIRSLTNSGGVAYSEWFAGNDAQGDVKFVESYSTGTGEQGSDTLRRAYLAELVQTTADNDFSILDQDTVTEVHIWATMMKDLRKGDFFDMLQQYKALPPKLKDDKIFLKLRVQATQEFRFRDPQQYRGALADIDRLYLGDPTVDLLSIDEQIREKRFDEARECVDRLEAFTGGDPFLLAYEGNIDVAEGGEKNFIDAQILYQRAVQQEPTLEAPYWGLLRLSVQQGNYDDTVKLLERLTKVLNAKLPNLEYDPCYAGFVQSDVYRSWKDSQPRPCTIDQASALAQKLESGLNSDDAALVASVVDFPTLLRNATEGISAPPGYREGFVSAGSKEKWTEKWLKFGRVPGEQFHLLRVRPQDGTYVAILRVMIKDSCLDYFEWFVGTDGLGQPKFVDNYSVVESARYTEFVRRIYLSASTKKYPGMVDELSAPDQLRLAGMRRTPAMAQAINADNFADELSQYKLLPPTLQKDKLFMRLRVSAAERLRFQDPQRLDDALADYARLFPGDPAVDFVYLNERISDRQFAAARTCVDHLETFTGGDPYLISREGDIDMDAGGDANLAEARKLFEQSIREEPTLQEGYWGLLKVSVLERNYDETVKQLDWLTKTFGVDASNVAWEPFYADFVKSDAYRKWKQSQAVPATMASK